MLANDMEQDKQQHKMMPRRPIINKKTQITATKFADASGRGADEARIPPAWLEPVGVGDSKGHSRGRERSAGDPRG